MSCDEQEIYILKADRLIRRNIDGLYVADPIKRYYNITQLDYVTLKSIDDVKKELIELFGANIDEKRCDFNIIQFSLYIGCNMSPVDINFYIAENEDLLKNLIKV